jgi:hypothetical protein
MGAFPNPATNTLNIRIPGVKGSADIRVIDMYGKQVLFRSSSQVNTQLDISRLPAGMYLVKVVNDGKETTMKIVKE